MNRITDHPVLDEPLDRVNHVAFVGKRRMREAQMTQAAAAIFKFPAQSPQFPHRAADRARKAATVRLAADRLPGLETCAATLGGGEVIELELGVTVYPPRERGGRWRTVWHEDGVRQQCESVSEEKPAAKLDKVRQRIVMGASNTARPRMDLIAWYLNPDRLPVEARWSRKHADTQRRLCQRVCCACHRRGRLPGNHGPPQITRSKLTADA